MMLLGRVKNGVVVLYSGASLAEGTVVEVRPAAPDTQASAEVSKERQEALRALIGICKTPNPPTDEEVERIVEEEIMKKYG